jgi:hypothetical protein
MKRSKSLQNAHKTIENGQERSETVRNGQKRSGTVNGQRSTVRNGERSGKVNGQEHLGTIESERSNALERIVENGHDTVTLRSRLRSKNERNTLQYLFIFWSANVTVILLTFRTVILYSMTVPDRSPFLAVS